VRIFVVGAGQVGATVVEALHHEHQLTVIDLDRARLTAISHHYDVATVEGNGASRRTLQDAGIRDADLLIACTSRDEPNIVSSMFAKMLSPETKTIVRTTNIEYLEIWQERLLDVDFMVSSELETAHAIARIIGVPAARQTDVFADGQVQMVEFGVEAVGGSDGVIGVPLREARIPAESKVASIIRGGRMILPRGDAVIEPGDRVVIIGSPAAARAWSELVAPGDKRVDDVIIVGAGQTGVAVARVLLDQGIGVRLIEADAERARAVAEELPDTRVFHATGIDPDFIERERIGQARAAIFAMPDDAKNLFAASLVRLHGVSFTVAVVHDPIAAEVVERVVTAEEIVRWAHDPRVRQLSMLEGDRFEVLDITVREESKLVHKPFKELPMTGSLIGAIVRDGTAIFPHGDDQLEPGDRAIIFTESARVPEVERAL
jgi:trk system potassium uptake protein TrkA